ncbi:class I SAM-dependent methyltransferase [Methanobrevibacter sp.]|uniref:class I SAM-dependent methyltransferase n=1 Tax=Methanobrevibacter sp. TaxID=66852 RepID=UPI00388E02A5
MGIFDNMRKPKGKLGEIQLKSMNKEHTPISLWVLKHLDIKETDTILDIGCGGGININRMGEKAKKVYGVDYSEKSVKISKEVNDELIKKGTVEIKQGNVENLEFEDESFDIVTAFETVYFWPDVEKCFGEVKRVLKPGGIFMIGMESNGSEHITMKISEKLIDMTAYNDRELRTFLENNEFSQITVYLKDSKNRKEKIMTNEGTRLIDDDWDNFSFSDRFLEWMCVIAEK